MNDRSEQTLHPSSATTAYRLPPTAYRLPSIVYRVRIADYCSVQAVVI
jgi:hypothetical protein